MRSGYDQETSRENTEREPLLTYRPLEGNVSSKGRKPSYDTAPDEPIDELCLVAMVGFSLTPYPASLKLCAVCRSTDTSCDTPRSAIVTPKSLSICVIVMG